MFSSRGNTAFLSLSVERNRDALGTQAGELSCAAGRRQLSYRRREGIDDAQDCRTFPARYVTASRRRSHHVTQQKPSVLESQYAAASEWSLVSSFCKSTHDTMNLKFGDMHCYVRPHDDTEHDAPGRQSPPA